MDDLISRQAAIDSIEKHLRFGDELYPLTDTDKVLNHGFEIAASCVYNLPSAQPEQRWVPCSETIDIPENEVLCCDRYGNEMIGYLAYTDEQWLCESDAEMMYDAVAWMEKPNPWKGEKNDC